MTLQTQVGLYQSPAVEGDFASTNPNASVVAWDGTFVAGTGGVTQARFAWADGNGLVTNAGSGVPTGFVRRDASAVITQWLSEYSSVIPQGYQVTLMAAGDYWVRTGTNATIGQKVFASLTTGQIQTGAAGATISGYVETNFIVATTASAGQLIKMSTWGA